MATVGFEMIETVAIETHSAPRLSQKQNENVEDSSDVYVPQRYHRLASIISKDKNWAIFRRFDELNILQLMAMQAEIVELQFLYKLKCQEDEKKETTYSGCFHDLRRDASQQTRPRASTTSSTDSRTPGHGPGQKPRGQYELLMDLRKLTSEYNNLLLQVSQLSQIKPPQKSQLKRLKEWLRDRKGGKNFLAQSGIETYTWKPENTSDYVSLRDLHEDSDLFTTFIKEVLLYAFDRLFGDGWKAVTIVDVESGLKSYSDSKLTTASNVVAVILSSILPVLTIFVLNVLKTTTARIGLTVVFTATFACVLAVCSTAKRVEIFAATATFAAIEVVFIGSALGK